MWHPAAEVGPAGAQTGQTGSHVESVSLLSAGDESVQDFLCHSVRLRLGRHPPGLHTGLSLYSLSHIRMFLITSALIFHHYCNPIRRLLPVSHTETDISVSSGRHSRRLHLLLRLPDWSSVPGPSPELPKPWPRPLHPRFHTAAVLLLLWLAQGEGKCSFTIFNTYLTN